MLRMACRLCDNTDKYGLSLLYSAKPKKTVKHKTTRRLFLAKLKDLKSSQFFFTKKKNAAKAKGAQAIINLVMCDASSSSLPVIMLLAETITNDHPLLA